jgi:hypothetical protein
VIRSFENFSQSSCTSVEATSASTSAVVPGTTKVTESSEAAEDKSACFRLGTEDFADTFDVNEGTDIVKRDLNC